MKNKIITGDCQLVLDELPDESAHLILFSPPYDGIRTYNATSSEYNLGLIGYDIENVLVDGGIAIMIIQSQTKNFRKSLTMFKAVNQWDYFGLNLWEMLIYQRPGRPGAWWNKRFRVDHEYILVFFKGDKPRYFNKEHMLIPSKHAGKKWSGTQRLTDGTLIKKEGIVKDKKCPGTILSYASSNTEGNKLKMKHPATMPDKMAEDLIRCFTKPGDLVLDPFCGSGTTLVAAKKLERNYIGIDINEEYCKIAEERIKNEGISKT